MAKGYEDLSRRALIQLGKDFDQDNEAALLHYLAENGSNYENIRPMEKIIVKADAVTDSIKESAKNIKNVLNEHSGKVISSVVDAIITASSETEKGLIELKENIELK